MSINNITKVECTTALNQLKRKIPYGYDLNIYRGCAHSCKYCYAIYSHQYLGAPDFSEVFAKVNIAQQLDKELSHPGWKREVINIGGVTDSYQPAEQNLKIMPDVLRVLIKHKTPAIISTKSDLILRDYDLIAQLANITYVNIASTITTVDQNIAELIEPGASTSQQRFSMLTQFRKTNASVGLHTMPIIPFLTDSYQNIEGLCAAAQKANVHYMLPGVLYLRGATRTVFLNFIEHNFTDKYNQFLQLYKTGAANKDYKDNLYNNIVNPLRKKFNISSSYIKPMREKMHND